MEKVLEILRKVARHRMARWVVLGAILLLVVKMVGQLPSHVEVAYHLGQARTELQRVEMRYLKGGEEVRNVAFSYAGTPAGETQLHDVQLVDGDYTVAVQLHYPDGKVRHLDRPLFVRGAGRVSIYLK